MRQRDDGLQAVPHTLVVHGVGFMDEITNWP